MKALKTFVRVVDRINHWIGLAVSVLLPAMVCVLAFEVISRYIFKRPTLWAYDMAIFMFGYTGLLAGAHVLKCNEHVNVDIVYDRLSPRSKALANTLTGLLFFFFIILVIVYSWKYALFALQTKQTTATEWGPPVAHFKLMIPVGAFLLLIQGIANWIRNLYFAITLKELDV